MSTNLVDLLDEHARRHPGRVACIDDARSVDFGELAHRSRVAARALSRAGIAAGEVVGILMTPSVDLVVAVWAILRADAAYLPLAIDYPAERIGFMAEDSDVRVVVTDEGTAELAARALPNRIHILRMDTATVTDTEPVTEPDPTVGEFAPLVDTTPAYIIYTSGTTGSPKGVVISHRAITHQMIWLGATLELAPGARILMKTPISFDAAQWELLANACGATVVVAPAGIAANPEGILERVASHRITHLQCVPTVWAELIALPGIAETASLRVVASGGEALTVSLAERMRAQLPGVRAVNLYGPTEVTINSAWFDFTEAPLSGATVPIGVRVENCAVFVVDDKDDPVEPGQVGELIIGGPQLAEGYRNRPEVTAERFVELAVGGAPVQRYYRTGDLARWRTGGILEFVGRNDEQVKVNGHRVEANEVRLWIEAHHWVRSAAVVPWVSPRGSTQLAAFIELDPEQAPLMDQEQAGRHHRSKSTRTQVAAQLADLGVRDMGDQPRILMPGAVATDEQRRRVFARKTYRTFTSDPIDLGEVENLLRQLPMRHRSATGGTPTLRLLGTLLRWFGPFHSPDRLLPKYSYASPGALNATQLYLEVSGLPGLGEGTYYFHRSQHALYWVGPARRPGVRLHLVGLPRVIESVYSTNVTEVLHFEAGHMLGVLDEIGGELGLSIRVGEPTGVPGVTEGVVTASVELDGPPSPPDDPMALTVLVQVHGAVSGARAGLYQFADGRLEFLTDDKIERRHVIAINQSSFERASFGVVLATGTDRGWAGLRGMGRALAHLQQLGTHARIGFMASGYSSLTGRDLPTARRVQELLPAEAHGSLLTYFALGGRISAEQLESTGMAEDILHMKGPEELLKDDLRAVVPHYMVPATVHVLDRIPLSHNGKQDRAALVALAGDLGAGPTRPSAPPESPVEREVARIWSEVLDYRPAYLGDNFFAQGGNSISALRLTRSLNQALGVELGVQTIFSSPTLAELAAAADQDSPGSGRRILHLAGPRDTATATTLLWPGLGGYPMSLRTLAQQLAQRCHGVYGVQTRGLNTGEAPPDHLGSLIDQDVDEILGLGLPEPLRIVGYSFGARVAAEVAQRLRHRGHQVEELVLIAPGSPVIPGHPDPDRADYTSTYFKRILASVFSRTLHPDYAAELDERVTGRKEFIELILAYESEFGPEIVDRITTVVERTYDFRAQPVEVDAELVDDSHFLRARGDGPSFADIPSSPLRERSRPVMNLPYDHYEIVTTGAADVAFAVMDENMDKELI